MLTEWGLSTARQKAVATEASTMFPPCLMTLRPHALAWVPPEEIATSLPTASQQLAVLFHFLKSKWSCIDLGFEEVVMHDVNVIPKIIKDLRLN